MAASSADRVSVNKMQRSIPMAASTGHAAVSRALVEWLVKAEPAKLHLQHPFPKHPIHGVIDVPLINQPKLPRQLDF